MLAQQRTLKCSLYVTLGDEGAAMKAGLDRLRTVLEEKAGKGLRWDLVEMLDEDHGSIVLRSHYNAFEKIFEGWRLPRTRTGTFKGGIEGGRGPLRQAVGPPRLGHHAARGHDQRPGLCDDGRTPDRRRAGVSPDQRPQLPRAAPTPTTAWAKALEAAGRLDEALAKYEEAIKRGEAGKDPLLDAFRAHRDAARKKMAERR